MEAQPAGHLPPASPAAVALPPSDDDEMAAWLYPIVHPGDLAGLAAAVDDLQAAPVKEEATDHQEKETEKKVDAQQAAADHKSEDKLPKTEQKCRALVRNKHVVYHFRKKPTPYVLVCVRLLLIPQLKLLT